MVEITVLDHHARHQLDDLISVHVIVVTSLVVDSKLEREGRERENSRERDVSELISEYGDTCTQ